MKSIQPKQGLAILCAMVGAMVLAGPSFAQLPQMTGNFQMSSGNPLTNSAPNGATPYQPNLALEAASPTYSATGGAFGGGAYTFDGSSQHLGFGGAGNAFYVSMTYPPEVDNVGSWTVSFWVKTTDTGTAAVDNTGGSGRGVEVPVLADTRGFVSFGVDGGKAAVYGGYVGGMTPALLLGTSDIADGQGHFVTFVANNGGPLDIYVDGSLESGSTSGIPGNGNQFPENSVGADYGGTSPYYGNGTPYTVSDMQIWAGALTQSQIGTDVLGIPEPSSLALLGLGGLLLWRKCKRA